MIFEEMITINTLTCVSHHVKWGLVSIVLNRNKQVSNLELTRRFLLFISFLKTMGRLAEMQRKLLEVGELKLLIF